MNDMMTLPQARLAPMTMTMSAMNREDVRFFSGQSHPDLAAGITDYLGVPLEKSSFRRFSNDNMQIQLGASVRGRQVYIIQSLIPPVSEHLLELLIMLDIARSAGASQVHAIIPYYSYARSDKKDAPRISITARLIADLLETSGATHVMTMQLHSAQVHGFFRVPTDPLTARALFVDYIRHHYELDEDSAIVVAPDAGSAKSAMRFASQLGIGVAVAIKQRVSDTEVRISKSLKKQVKGYRLAIMYDDEISTGGSITELCNVLVKSGVEQLCVICTHGLFVGNAIERLAAFPQIREIIATDTVPIPSAKRLPNMTVLSVASIFGEAILRNYLRQSIGDLFSFWEGAE